MHISVLTSPEKQLLITHLLAKRAIHDDNDMVNVIIGALKKTNCDSYKLKHMRLGGFH